MNLIARHCRLNLFTLRVKGFSLIELMIVVLIIGIGASMAVLHIDNGDERLKSEARRLFAMAQYARDDAILKGQSMGLVVNYTHYYFTRYEKGQWLQIKEKPYQYFELSSDIRMRLFFSGKLSASAGQTNNPMLEKKELIYFLPTGESSEFEILINNNNDSGYVLNSSIFGEMSLKKSEAL